MRRRLLEWSWIISLLLLTGCIALYADSLLWKGRYVLSATDDVYMLIADGRLALFRQTGYVGESQPRVLNPRGFGSNHRPKERAYFDWRSRTTGIGPYFVTGQLSFPADPVIGPRTIRYTAFTFPGLSYHRDRESQLKQSRWKCEVSLLIPLFLLFAISGLTWRRLRPCDRCGG